MTSTAGSRERATSPVVGTVLLIAIAVCLAGVLAAGTETWSPTTAAPGAAFDIEATGGTGEITLTHVAGDPIDVAALDLRIAVEGTPLSDQPPVPFFAADGFVSGPDGPLNPSGDAEWSPGQSSTLRVATTNAPTIDSGDRITVTLTVDDTRVARLEATAT